MRNPHKTGCPWYGVKMSDPAVDELDGTPCFCADSELNDTLADIARTRLPPTPGFSKLGPAAQERALQRAKNFYPFD